MGSSLEKVLKGEDESYRSLDDFFSDDYYWSSMLFMDGLYYCFFRADKNSKTNVSEVEFEIEGDFNISKLQRSGGKLFLSDYLVDEDKNAIESMNNVVCDLSYDGNLLNITHHIKKIDFQEEDFLLLIIDVPYGREVIKLYDSKNDEIIKEFSKKLKQILTNS